MADDVDAAGDDLAGAARAVYANGSPTGKGGGTSKRDLHEVVARDSDTASGRILLY